MLLATHSCLQVQNVTCLYCLNCVLRRQLLNTIKTLPQIIPCASLCGCVLRQCAHFAQYQEKISIRFNVEWGAAPKVPLLRWSGFVSVGHLSSIQSAARKCFKRRFLSSVCGSEGPFEGEEVWRRAAGSGSHITSFLFSAQNYFISVSHMCTVDLGYPLIYLDVKVKNGF